MTDGRSAEPEQPIEQASSTDDTLLSDVVAGQAKSGKWHLQDGNGCLNAGQAAIERRRAVTVLADKRNREWCRYCRERLRQLELQAEINKLRAKLDDREEALEVETGANHGVETSVDAPAASGWGQRPQGGDDNA